MEEGARFPAVAAKAGHYESFYIKACRPGGGQGIWIRHTVHKRPGAEPNASIWFVLFDAGAEGPRATKVTVPAAKLSAPAGSWIRVDGAEIGPGRATGTVATDALVASWGLSFTGGAEPCRYLPADWLYEAPVPRTKFVAPFPNARFNGALDVDGTTIELKGWPGMIGHNWGSEHAERWVWLEGTGFADQPEAYFDAGAARVRIGPWTTRWIPAGMLVAGRGRPPPRRDRSDPLEPDQRAPDLLRLPPQRPRRRGGGPGHGAGQGLRRLALRRSRRARAQHPELLDLRPRADASPARACPSASCACPAAGRTSSECARPTTASRSSPTPTAERRGAGTQRPLTTLRKCIQRS